MTPSWGLHIREGLAVARILGGFQIFLLLVAALWAGCWIWLKDSQGPASVTQVALGILAILLAMLQVLILEPKM